MKCEYKLDCVTACMRREQRDRATIGRVRYGSPESGSLSNTCTGRTLMILARNLGWESVQGDFGRRGGRLGGVRRRFRVEPIVVIAPVC